MTLRLNIGSASGQPGQLAYGSLEAVALPSGGSDQFPIIIAQGPTDGPVLWLTASIHGAEYAGIAVIHKLLTVKLASQLHGAIVAVPTLNPAGLRTGERSAYYLRGQDPNRLFPGSSTKRSAGTPESPASPLEMAYQRLFECVERTADFLIDLHNYSLGALPFALRDPVYYRAGRDRSAAQQLQDKVGEMLTAFGFTIVHEFVSAEYLKKNLHRSVSGAALLTAHIPAFTAELGGYMTVDTAVVDAAVIGLRNVLRWAGMLDSPSEPITSIRRLPIDYPVRRMSHPFAPESGILHYFVKAGDVIEIGQSLVQITDILGRPLGPDDGILHSEYDGIVLGIIHGATCYQNDPLLSIAIRDDSDLIIPFPT